MINNKTNILMDRLSDEEFLEFVYRIKRILNSSVKTNAEKIITMSQSFSPARPQLPQQ